MSLIPGTQPSAAKIYPSSADVDSLRVFDMSINDTSMYGTYSVGEPASAHHEGVMTSNYFDPDIVLTPELSSTVVDAVTSLLAASNAGNYLDKVQDHLNGGEF